MYNLTNFTNADTVGGLVSYSNQAAEGYLFMLILLALFLIALWRLKDTAFELTLLVGSWACFLLSLVLLYGSYVNTNVVILFLVIACFSSFYVWLTNQY